MSGEKVSKLEINDLFDSMKDENNRLLAQLLLAVKCIEVLDNYRNYLMISCNNCECDHNLEIKLKFNDLENDFKTIENEKQIILNYNKNAFTITQSLIAREIPKKVVKKKFNRVKKRVGRVGRVKKVITKELVVKTEPNVSEPQFFCNNFNETNDKKDYKLSIKANNLVSSQQKSIKSKPTKNAIILAMKSKAKNMIKGRKGFQCDYCDYKNISFNRVESHVNKEHINIRPYKCDKCGLSFTGKHLMNGHLKLMHSNVKYYCDWNECKFETINFNSLKEHRLRHIGDKQFKCVWPACDRSFITKSELMGHQKRVHNDLRAYRCEWPACDSTFKTSQDLKHHMCTHTGLKIHGCEWPGCEWRFTRKPQLDRHMLIHKEVRNFICNWPECDKKFRTSCALKVHLMVHRGERPFRCEWPQCDRRFTEKANMLRHFRTHNNKHKT